MSSPSSVITLGYGPGATVPLVLTLGYGIAELIDFVGTDYTSDGEPAHYTVKARQLHYTQYGMRPEFTVPHTRTESTMHAASPDYSVAGV